MSPYLGGLIAIAVAANGCSDIVCTTQPRPAIKAEIRDSVTNAPAALGASLIVTNQSVYDSTAFPYESPTVLSAGNATAGTYTVRVRKAGYRLWEQTGIVVNGDRCGAEAVELQIRLRPKP
jgi:hypothetical protein